MSTKTPNKPCNYENQARLYKALMHPARLAILDVLRYGEHCVCHLEAALGYRQAYISQHLMLLRDAGLIEDRRDGWNNYYRVTKPDVYKVIDAALRLIGDNSDRDSISRFENPLPNCTCPKCNPDTQTNSDPHVCEPPITSPGKPSIV
ncbi:MAG: helix-turn-helix transcriptional regulator [Anaerolineales bacterium]|nr:helix-turn-helix transcriptional regulator [Anaerolineales bacterium]